MREPASNIADLCDKHSRELPQTLDDGHTKFVKVRFPISGRDTTENMWCVVADFDARIGILENDPIALTYVKIGDEVRFREKDGFYYYITPEQQ